MSETNPVKERVVCEVHGGPLVDGTATHRLEADCVEMDLALVEIEELHFPHAESLVWGRGLRDPEPVRYCPECRRARSAWSGAPGDWSAKARWMRLGFDPYRGKAMTGPEATLVQDYVWVERYIRAMVALGHGPFLNWDGCRSAEELILREVAAARADGAPPDAAFRARGRWMTLEGIRDEGVRGALGLERW